MPEDPFAHTVDRWRAGFVAVDEEADALGERLHEALTGAPSTEAHTRAREALVGLQRAGDQAMRRVRALVHDVDRLRDEWTAAHRYTDEGLATLLQRLADRFAVGPAVGARAWLDALLDAAAAGEAAAAATIATADLDWPEDLRGGAERLGKAFAGWPAGGATPPPEPVEELARGGLAGWEAVPSADLRCRAHRFAAWAVLRASGDADRAGRHLDDAALLAPRAGGVLADRASLELFVGDLDAAATDAQHAIELAPDEPSGYLALGVWAELRGKFSGADDLYRRGFDAMPLPAVARIHRRCVLIDPPGRMLTAAATLLLEAGRSDEALDLATVALRSGVRGLEAHPDADTYVIRRRALEQLPDQPASAVARAGTQAGRRLLWNGDIDRAIEELDHAASLGGDAAAGWLLADALVTKSYPLAAPVPDQAIVAQARSAWEAWAGQVGLPRGRTSWAYVTRALIADLESQRPGADRRASLFEALMYVEKALVHNHTDAQRLGYLAQFLRYLGLEQLAFEAADAGYRLASADRQVLAERLPLLANRRQFDEAEKVAARLVAMYGEDPWISAFRAWLALHHLRDPGRTIDLLQLPIAEGNDHTWYLEMQALAMILLDDVDGARTAYRRMVDEVPTDGNTKCRLARASLALGDGAAARRWLAEAGLDATTPRVAQRVTEALIAAADGHTRAAAGHLADAVELAASAVEVDDLVFEALLTLRVIDAPGRLDARDRDHELHEATKDVVANRKATLERHPVTPDSELDEALAGVTSATPGVAGVALVAVAARRDAAAGRHEAARERYESLRGSPFEPEASIALERQPTLPAPT